ncbi:MAG: hypothetical protein R6U62_09240 [Bacteroidales bacterium]
MKSFIKIFGLLLLTALFACEKNDPLADQGELTGNQAPFNLLAQIPDAEVGDTVILRTVCWAVDDNITQVNFYHEGVKLRTFEVTMTFQTEDDMFDLKAVVPQDSIFIDRTHIAGYPEEGSSLLDYYQTLQNAYVFEHDFVVPEVYGKLDQTNEALIQDIDDDVFHLIVEEFSTLFNRAAMIEAFPEINEFSLEYFIVDDDGFYTGEITEAAEQYITDNLDKALMQDFLKEAEASDNTRVTAESEALLDDNDSGLSSLRTFRVL